MNKQKLTYLSPETETLVVRFEGTILDASPTLVILSNALQESNVVDGGSGWSGGWDDPE